MKYKIVIDSCGELPFQYQNDIRFERVPLGLEVEGEVIMDDENFDQADFLEKVAVSAKCPKSFCPSPERFMEAYRTEAENVFVFTLSSKLTFLISNSIINKIIYPQKELTWHIHTFLKSAAFTQKSL